MELAFAERLVCPHAHRETPLVVRADESRHGRLWRGRAGCPECLAEWEVRAGVAEFGPACGLAAAPVDDADALAALLSLSDPAPVLVDGATAAVVATLIHAYGASVIVVDPDGQPEGAVPAAVLRGPDVLPVASSAVRAALLLRPGRAAGFVASAVRCVAVGGRIVGADALPVPDGVTVMARDARVWVATRNAPHGQPIPLRRAPTAY